MTTTTLSRLLPTILNTPSPSLSAAIADARYHPAIEAALHLLNHDLNSAHFLVRHMQSAPAYEAMMLHAILHRLEGDLPNAMAWYDDVKDSEVFRQVWEKEGGIKGAEKMVNNRKDDGRWELQKVLDYCIGKYGLDECVDARSTYVTPSEKIKKAGEGQVTGNEQRRF